MEYLAVHFGHDGNLCRLSSRGWTHVELERITRKKHYFSKPADFPLRDQLALIGTDPGEPGLELATVCHSIHAGSFDLKDVVFAFTDPRPPAPHKLFPGMRLYLLEHHFAHACYVYFTRPADMEEPDVLAYDGWGLHTDRVFFDRSLRPVDSSVLGLGRLWDDVSRLLFSDSNQAGKTMGLAAYGSHSPGIEEILLGYLGLMDRFNRLPDMESRILSKAQYFRAATQNLMGSFPNPPEPVRRDLARTLQDLSLRLVLSYLERVRTSPDLCISGGVGLNGYINQAILERGLYRRVYVAPACGDCGLSLGAALWMLNQVEGRRIWEPASLMYGGLEYPLGEQAIGDLVAGTGLRVRRLDFPELCAFTVGKLAEGKIIGWYQGRSESGPRALGNRSILADPRPLGMKDQLNSRVKHREPFRPFAPAILEQHVGEWFEGVREARFMLNICRFQPGRGEQVPAVRHVDDTGRLQTVRRQDNERFYDLISAFQEKTGIPMLLNTSLNDKGEPIVETPQDALRTFRATGLDLLVLGDYLLEKNL